MPKRTPEQLLSEANTALRRGLSSMRLMEIDILAHHECLPMPPLHAPQTPEAIDAYAGELLSNLYDQGAGHHDRSAAWIKARETCPHLGSRTVQALYEVIDNWRCLVGCAAGHAQRQRTVFGLAERAEFLRARLDEYANATRDAHTSA